MSATRETIIPAKPDQRIWVLSNAGRVNQQCDIIDVIAWVVGPDGPPIPVTVAGRLAPGAEYILSTEAGWMVLPSAKSLDNSCDVTAWLKSRHVG
jgi:hypothetical protein